MKKLKEIGMGAFRPDGFGAGGYRHKNTTAPLSDADTAFSRYSQRVNKGYEFEEMEEDDEDIILECRVYRAGKYMLVETLDNLNETSVDDLNVMNQKLVNQSRNSKEKVDDLEDLDDMIDEMSAGGVAGPAVPMGFTSKGRPETARQRKKRQKFNREKSFPYRD